MLNVTRVPLSQLVHDAANVRKHGKKNLRAIAGSLKQFGQVEPLVVQKSTMRVIGGNGRLEAMRELGETEADVVLLDVDDTKATALAIALNRTGELATWDYEGLAGLLASLEGKFAVDTIGFDSADLANLLNAEWSPAPKEPLPEGEPEDEDGDPLKAYALVIRLSESQADTFKQAMERVRTINDAPDMAEATCLQLICNEYLSREGS